MSDQPYKAARACFDSYAGMTPDDIDGTCRLDEEGLTLTPEMSRSQIIHAAWEARNFGAQSEHVGALGATEEIGECIDAMLNLLLMARANGRMAHAVLKSEQKIRGLGDKEKYRAAAADALGDIMIYATSLATALRIDIGVLYIETMYEVTQRDWIKKPVTAADELAADDNDGG